MKEDVYITSHKFGKEFYIRVKDFKDVVEKIQNKYRDLEEENRKLKEDVDFFYKSAKQFREENEKLKEKIKDHQFYEEKLEHRIIEFEELLHGE